MNIYKVLLLVVHIFTCNLTRTLIAICCFSAIVPLQNTISVLSLMLVHNLEVQDKIREQLMSLNEDVTIDDIRKLPYIEACILELKRFHTPLPVSARHCNRSGNDVFENYIIPKNTEICVYSASCENGTYARWFQFS